MPNSEICLNDELDEDTLKLDEAQKAECRRNGSHPSTALALMQEAQADLEAGRIAQAKAKATRANDLDVTWDLLDMTPDNLIDEVARLEKQTPAETNIQQLAAQNSQADEMPPLDDILETQTERVAQTRPADEREIESPVAVNPTRMSALELYQRGKLAIVLVIGAGRQMLPPGLRLGRAADARRDQEIREYLAQHRVKARKIQLLARGKFRRRARPGGERRIPKRAIDKFDEQRQVSIEKLRTEIRNAAFRAEGLSAAEPQKALDIIDKAQASVENSGLDERVTAQLLKQLAKSRETVEYNRKINAPKIEMSKRKAEVEDTIKREEQAKIRIEQEYAEKVEKYNQLLREKRFDEAIVIGK